MDAAVEETGENNNNVVSLFSSIHPYSWISADPKLFDTHFIQLTKRNAKGQAKYRCRMCHHEFSCCGRRRRLQHIVGNDFMIGKSKNVINCINPYQPLKQALLQIYLKDQNQKEGEGEGGAGAGGTGAGDGDGDGEAHMVDKPEHYEREFEDLLQEISFSSSSDVWDVHTNRSFSASSSLSSSLSLPNLLHNDDNDERLIKRIKSASPTVPLPSKGESMSVTEEGIDEGLGLMPEVTYESRVHLNRAILNFFFVYRIPLTAVENPDFHQLIDAVLQSKKHFD